jgi:hypothetical protein
LIGNALGYSIRLRSGGMSGGSCIDQIDCVALARW